MNCHSLLLTTNRFDMRQIIFILSLLIGSQFYNSQVFAQSEENPVVELKSPYHTVLNHLKFLNEENLKPRLAARSLYSPEEYSEQQVIDLSKKLKMIFDGRGLYIAVEEIPRNPNYYDSLRDEREYIVHKDLPEIYLKKYGDQWKYSESSVESIQSLYNSTFILGVDHLIDILPHGAEKKVMGLKIWQLIGIFIIITISFLLERLIDFVLRKIARRLLVIRGADKIAKKVILPVTRPLSLLIILGIILILIPGLMLPIELNKYLIMGIHAIIPILVTIVAYKLTDLLSDYLMAKAEQTESTLDDQLIPLLRKILKVFVILIGSLFVLLNLKVNIIPLITGLSIGSLALALAAQDTLKNFFGSIMIFVDRPFQIGQWITTDGVDGTVEEVGFRSTRVRTFRNSLLSVPNGKLADSTIDNHGLRVYRRFYTQIGLMYDTPPQAIEVFVEGLKDLVLQHPNTVKDRMEIHFNEMADFSLNIMFYIFFDVPTWSAELKARDEILLGIVRLADAVGVNFAFPTTTLHMETFPGKEGLSPTYELDKEKLQALKNDFIKNNQKN